MSRIVNALETSGLLAIATLLIVALNGNYWYDIKGADLTEQGFGENLTLHGGLFRSCGPPLDPDSGKDEDCPQFKGWDSWTISQWFLPFNFLRQLDLDERRF